MEDGIDAAEEHGLKLVTANGEADLSTDGGRMYARIKAAVARAEVERKGARQTAAHRQRAAQGRAPKGVRPLGYATNGSTIEHEADAVRAIYAAFDRGVSLRAIAGALSGEEGNHIPRGVPQIPRHTRTLTIERNARRAEENTSLPKEKQKKLRPVPEDTAWLSSTVLGILRNPRYAGYSIYTPIMLRTIKKNAAAAGSAGAGTAASKTLVSRRTLQHDTIVRDENNNPVLGQWEALVPEDMWWRVQTRLDDRSRIKNRGGNTERKHLGSGLFRCGIEDPLTHEVCGEPMKSHNVRYRCPQHVMRSRDVIDSYVLSAAAEMLNSLDIRVDATTYSDPKVAQINTEISAAESLIARARHDYEQQFIEGPDFKRIREHQQAIIAKLEASKNKLLGNSALNTILRTQDPGLAFLNSDLGTKRSVLDALCTVYLRSHPRGRKTFNPDSVRIDWKI